MMPNTPLLQLDVHVTAGQTYTGTVGGVTGPVDVRDGDTVDAPRLVRLRDRQRTFVWQPNESGKRTLLVTGWPGQRDQATLSLVGSAGQHAKAAA
jgi:hypothetical protein